MDKFCKIYVFLQCSFVNNLCRTTFYRTHILASLFYMNYYDLYNAFIINVINV